VNPLPALDKKTGRRLLQGFLNGLRKVSILALVILGIFLLQKFLPVQAWLQRGTSTFRDLGIPGILLFIVTYVLLILVFTPGPLLSLTAGTLYGLEKGYLVTAAGSLTAAAAAFVIARAFRNKARKWVSKYQAFQAVEGAGAAQPWRTLLSVHLCPLFPVTIANYMLTLAGIPFPLYMLGAWLGMLPGLLFYVYIGHLGGNLALEGLHLSARDFWIFGTARVALWLVGIGATISFAALVKRHRKKAVPESARA
jgi:uncharacterized membrane protein YdjX (TVP38/TMEM64 family)